MRFDSVYCDTEGNIILLTRIVCKKKWKWTSKHVRFTETEAYIKRLKKYMKLTRLGDYR